MSNRTKLFIIIPVLTGLAILYYFIDPGESRFAPKCIFHSLTGWDCPGCGSQRMLHALLHGNLREAWYHNALFMSLIPLLIPMGYLELTHKRFPKAYAAIHSIWLVIAIAVAIIAWGILRNLL